MIDDKNIKGITPTQFITMMHDCSKWLEVFNAAGQDIFGDDFNMVAVLVGIAVAGFGIPANEFMDKVEAIAEKYNKERKDTTDELIKKFGIKLEGKDDTHPS